MYAFLCLLLWLSVGPTGQIVETGAGLCLNSFTLSGSWTLDSCWGYSPLSVHKDNIDKRQTISTFLFFFIKLFNQLIAYVWVHTLDDRQICAQSFCWLFSPGDESALKGVKQVDSSMWSPSCYPHLQPWLLYCQYVVYIFFVEMTVNFYYDFCIFGRLSISSSMLDVWKCCWGGNITLRGWGCTDNLVVVREFLHTIQSIPHIEQWSSVPIVWSFVGLLPLFSISCKSVSLLWTYGIQIVQIS